MPLASERQKAKKRLGATPSHYLAWLIRFVQVDLDTLSAGQLSDLGWEFVTLESLDVLGTLFGGMKSANGTKKAPLLLEDGMGQLIREKPADPKELHQVQDALRPRVNEFLSNHQTSLEFSSLTLTIESLVPFFTNDPKAAFAYPCRLGLTVTEKDEWNLKLIFLLAHLGHEVRQCRECSTIFVAERKDQFFCTRRCVSRSAQREFQKRKREKLTTKTTPKKPKKRSK